MIFNKDRFLNFARYDLTINKVLYRNLALVTIIGAMGISMMGFFVRYEVWKGIMNTEINMTTTYESGDNSIGRTYQGDLSMFGIGQPGSYEHYNTMPMTSCVILAFILIMNTIFAGCWLHNLRSKQGRINELTLPATNMEKFTWHTVSMIIGGYLLCFLALLFADGVNALCTLALLPKEDGIGSIIISIGQLLSMNLASMGMPVAPDPNIETLGIATTFCFIAGVLSDSAIYMFGNSIKYKYNIILTYIAMQILQFIAGIATIIFSAVNSNEMSAGAEGFAEKISIILYIAGALSCITALALPFMSYRLYTKAQITSKLNK
ncbi:MAG: hypothetical protein KBT29_09295 [Prevotellaceae bacterium]|nr:hypothetical protein [Candidatus Minthosoma caballi]